MRASSFFMALYSLNFNSGLNTDVLCVLFFSVVVVAVFLFPFFVFNGHENNIAPTNADKWSSLSPTSPSSPFNCRLNVV